MSSNPFRKKVLGAIDTARAQSPAKSSLRSNSPPAGDEDEHDATKPQENPSPSRKSACCRRRRYLQFRRNDPRRRLVPATAYNYSYVSQIPKERQGDPFNGAASTDESDRDSTATPAAATTAATGKPV